MRWTVFSDGSVTYAWVVLMCLITGLGSAFGGILKPIVVVVGSRWVHPGRDEGLWYE